MRNCAGFILVFDLTKRKTLFEVKDFIDSILRVKDCETAPIVLVGNKSDLESEREVTQKDLQTFLENYWKIPCIETSAKLRKNIDECFELIVKELRKSPTKVEEKPQKKGGCTLL
jgi:small GTP-binding protein